MFDVEEKKKELRSNYGENKEITGDYDESLAAKCVNGTFVGLKKNNIIEYKGIPFVAEPPIGDNRWKAPIEYKEDDRVYEAYYNAKSAYQAENFSESASLYYKSEDCLYLNIWKNDDDIKDKPVMVWIHGGAFEMGGTIDPMHDCYNFIEENPDVIMVTIAYRLAAFGFFHLSHLEDGADYPDAQNLGLLDQRVALKWIKENIASFGGDPSNITIFGESAGAASVSLLPLIDGAKDCFNKVIVQSGSPVFTRSVEQSIQCTNEIMEILNCKTVADLKKIPEEELAETYRILGLRVWPERDGKLLPLDPYEVYANGGCNDKIFLQGCNKDEVAYFVFCFGGPGQFTPWGVNRKEMKLAQLTDDEKELLEKFYENAEGEQYEKLRKLFDQIVFTAPMIRLSENIANAGGKSYSYYFRVESSVPLMLSGHAVELSTVFKHPEINGATGREFDETFSKTLRKMWVQFAKTGNPSLEASEAPNGKDNIWPLYDSKDKNVMVFDEFDIHVDKESNLNIVDWDNTYFLTKYYCI
ncbi:MAG: carboxylesterase family protein [Methanobacteriaceae archaeon]|nr:carboxylesterase family protein [Methanobacteriaceae archaeon]